MVFAVAIGIGDNDIGIVRDDPALAKLDRDVTDARADSFVDFLRLLTPIRNPGGDIVGELAHFRRHIDLAVDYLCIGLRDLVVVLEARGEEARFAIKRRDRCRILD